VSAAAGAVPGSIPLFLNCIFRIAFKLNLNSTYSWRRIVKSSSLKDLYVEQLQDLYSAENQLIKALPKMVEAASSDELRTSIEEHLEKTKQHAARLEKIFDRIGEDPKGKKCKGMEGLIKEASEVIEDDEMEEEVKDAAMIAAAQRVEHYEIAGYGCVRTYATLLGDREAAALLEQTLEEEKEADETLTEIAEQINVEAIEGGAEEEEEQVSSRRKTAGRRSKPAA
jgi:ferritin-like metal-binding protein YciE